MDEQKEKMNMSDACLIRSSKISWKVYSRLFTRAWNFADTPCIDFWQSPPVLNRRLLAS